MAKQYCFLDSTNTYDVDIKASWNEVCLMLVCDVIHEGQQFISKELTLGEWSG